MEDPIKKGATVRQVVKAMEGGKVIGAEYDFDNSTFRYLVEYQMDGENHTRWFSASEITEVK